MSKLEDLAKRIIDFRDARDWKQFHNPKDLAISLALEAAEVLEHFQWKTGQELKEYVEANKEHISEELADVLYWILLMTHDLDIDILATLEKKMQKNEQKYPVEKSKGNHKKHTQL
ncbi:MAG: nucleotide pyrophosphohydrolase [Candidatus Pacebacteria bacterium]|nr:nucleotide pyrophosphohydrolase [Candidatus Paceibacterota bacterium]